jgi:hypothetical protein
MQAQAAGFITNNFIEYRSFSRISGFARQGR